MRRGATAFAVVAVTGGLLAGCGSGPSQVGSAAIVGDTAISLEYVQDWFDRVVANRGNKERARANGQFDDIGRDIVTEAVQHELLLHTAAREGVQVNEEQVTDLLNELGGPVQAVQTVARDQGIQWLLYDETTIRNRVRDQLVALELGRKYFDSTAIKLDATKAESRTQALEKANTIAADPTRMRQMIDADIRNGFEATADQRIVMSEVPSAAAGSPLFGVPAGTVLVYQAGAPGGWWVIHVKERSTNEPRSTSPDAVAADRIDQSTMAAIGLRLLPALANDIEVKLNPRYGVWEPVSLRAVQNEGERPVITVPVRPSSN